MIGFRRFSLSAIAYICLTTLGCSSATDTSEDPTQLRLQAISDAYAKFLENNRRPPNSKEELTKYLPEGISATEVFVSPNDQEPFDIVWGVNLHQDSSVPGLVADDPEMKDLPPELSSTSGKVLVSEKTGKNGQRFVLFTDGVVLQLDDDVFAKAPKAKPGGKARRSQ
ncbi:MAG: hypothetical protein R3B84_17410 [Zavarzinella sp.]